MAAAAYEQSQLMVRLQEDESTTDKEVVAKLPDKFKQPNQWKVFAELIETYLSQLKGSGRIPLNYVI
jgi:glucosamine 6-phosphate synthetase-like amidotransferase/phosphosugar isomerase protein